MGFQETFNERVIPAAERAFGKMATLLHGDSLVELPLVSCLPRRGMQELQAIAVDGTRTRIFETQASYLTSGGLRFVPQAGDKIEYPGEQGGPQSWTAFPLVTDRCYDYDRNTESRIRIYAVREEDLLTATYLRPDRVNALLEITGLLSPIRFTDVDRDYEVHREERTTIRGVDKRQLAAAGVNGFERGATVEFNNTQWELDEAQTVWGVGSVTLGLIRIPLARMNEARRAAV